jgi:predicted ester cyclase
MMSETTKDRLRQGWERTWNQGDLDAVQEYYAAGVVVHGAPSELPPGTEGVKFVISGLRAAFPDVQLTSDDLIVEGDKAVSRWSWTGTHKGEYLGIAPTGKRVTTSGISIMRLADDKIAEIWSTSDELGLMQQIGAMPS